MNFNWSEYFNAETLEKMIRVLLILSIGVAIIYLVAFLGLSNAMMWPAVWPLAIADLGKFTKIGSSLLVTGIIGGAFLPLLFGYVAEHLSYQKAYLVGLPAYLFIIYYALWGSRIRIIKK